MAEYKGKKVPLNKVMRIRKGEPGYGRKKSKVFVKDGGKVKKVMFGDPNMKIRKKAFKDDNFRAHNCDNPTPRPSLLVLGM